MRASYKWLKELCRFDATAEQVAERLTSAGLEVEGHKRFGELPGVVVAEVRGKRPHPSKDKLSLVTVFDGEGELEVVCGAPNVPPAGKRILFARSGARLPSGMVISERVLAGVTSNGMICSESELDIGTESDGIIVLPDDVTAGPGVTATRALELDDVVFEIGLTPNRPDCLGHVGLARELSALLDAPLRLPELETPTSLQKPAAQPPRGARPVVLFNETPNAAAGSQVELEVTDVKRCPRYAMATIDGITVGTSPFWLRYRLHVLGLRAINNVVDVTNLVLLEYGYPTHAFDLELVHGGRIEVRTARASETIKTLDGIERKLTEDDLLICDGDRPLAVAGVMGGEESGVSAGTKRVLVECAYFDPRSVRRTSRRLGLHTDASHRFERGVDPRAVPGVLARVVSLICDVAGGATSTQGYEIYPEAFVPKEIQLRAPRIQGLLGANIPTGRAAQILESLGCEVETRAGLLRVRAPTWRPDLTREEDLIEEIARVYGYDNIPNEAPRVHASVGGAHPLTRFLRKLKERAAAIGLTEAVNLAFNSQKQLEQARSPQPALRVANPLSEERSVMRTSLLPGLAQNVLRAQRHQVEHVSLFELARVFTPTYDVLPQERYKLAFILSGSRPGWVGEPEAYDFYDGKGLLSALLAPLSRRALRAAVDAELAGEYPFLHPRRAARILLGDKAVGVLGELHPDVLDALELTGPVIYAELDVADLFALRSGESAPQVRALPRFPASSRDLAIVVEETREAGAVAAVLREAGGPLLEAVELFDLYRGGQLEAGKKSLAFRLTYRDSEGTLTDQRVDDAHGRVVEEAQRSFAASLRG
ncbi:MAG: Phenylalanyl-tRNA synthetase beta chain [Myxococcaceae bacterium]|nr:Phenylalanyl-tRNA synthetase beta chain [Myxococcaceae bacterium]